VTACQALVAIAKAENRRDRVLYAVNFKGGVSYDPEGTRLSFRWDFGDSTFSAEPDPKRIYTATGSLTLTDAGNLSAESHPLRIVARMK
jgi:hypothetical protein